MKKLCWLLLFNVQFSLAGTIVVNSTGGGLGTNQLCSLRAAINAANSDQPFSACPAGSGDDVIVLPNDGIFQFFEIDSDNVGPAALPVVTTGITIEGNGSQLTRTQTAPAMRFFNVSGGEDGFLTLRNMTLTGGVGNPAGGAISSYSSLALEGVNVIDNQATSTGGGIYCTNDFCSINNSLIKNNTANYGGGLESSSELYVNNSLFENNSATEGTRLAGGGILIASFNNGFMITNTTLSGNLAARGAGLVIENSNSNMAWLENLTITGSNSEGLIATYDFTPIPAYIKNSVLAGNDGLDCSSFAVLESLGHNLIEDNNCGLVDDSTDVFNLSAQLGPLEDNGGPTMTHAPSYSSPVIDTGSDDCGNLDQRGLFRPQDGNNDGIATCDRGAVELINQFIFNNGFESTTK